MKNVKGVLLPRDRLFKKVENSKKCPKESLYRDGFNKKIIRQCKSTRDENVLLSVPAGKALARYRNEARLSGVFRWSLLRPTDID